MRFSSPRVGQAFGSRLAMYASFPGIAGNNITSPDAPANQITGNLDLRAIASLVSWTNAPDFAVMIAKDNRVNPNRSYALYMYPGTGVIGMTRSIAGLGEFPFSSVPVTFAGNQIAGIRATHNIATGAVLFYTSLDFGITWQQLGAPAAVTVGAADAGNANMAVGSSSPGLIDLAIGKIFYTEVRNGIDGPVVASFNPTRALKNAATISSPTGEVWTVNTVGGGQIAQLF